VIQFRLLRPLALLYVAVAALLPELFSYADRHRREALSRFATGGAAGTIGRRGRGRALRVAAIALVALGLAMPVRLAPPADSQQLDDIVFLVDVSGSMSTQDVAPSRLERARRIVSGFTEQLRGERIALVTFAGNSTVECPLTTDYSFFRDSLRSASRTNVTVGGTRLGDAIRFALANAFDPVFGRRRQLIVLTDGGDQDSSPETAAREALRRNVFLLLVGVGDENAGGLVPVSEADPSPLLYEGQPVQTRLESRPLRALAAAGNGIYLSAGSAESAVRAMHAAGPGGRARSAVSAEETPVYEFPIALAILLLIAEWYVPPGRRAAAAAVTAVLLLPGTMPAQSMSQSTAPSKDGWQARGDDAFRRRDFKEAEVCYLKAANSAPGSAGILFDIALTEYRLQDFDRAAVDFASAAERTRDLALRAQARLGQGNAVFRSAAAKEQSEALNAYVSAVAAYRQALGANRKSAEAEFNIAIAKRRIADLRRQLAASANAFFAPISADGQAHSGAPEDLLEQERQRRLATSATVPSKKVDRDW
jgi:Ca-activated chloride channel family protein